MLTPDGAGSGGTASRLRRASTGAYLDAGASDPARGDGAETPRDRGRSGVTPVDPAPPRFVLDRPEGTPPGGTTANTAEDT